MPIIYLPKRYLAIPPNRVPEQEGDRAMEQKRIDKKEHIIIRLTLRVPEELDKLIREETVRRGTNMNQTMLHILHQYFNQK